MSLELHVYHLIDTPVATRRPAIPVETGSCKLIQRARCLVWPLQSYLHATKQFETSIQEDRYVPIATTVARLSAGAAGEAARFSIVPREVCDEGLHTGVSTRVYTPPYRLESALRSIGFTYSGRRTVRAAARRIA